MNWRRTLVKFFQWGLGELKEETSQVRNRLTREDVVRMINEHRESGKTLDLSNYDLQEADLHGLELPRAIFANLDSGQAANLRDVNFKGANLQSAMFTGAKMQGATLQNTNLQQADLRFCNLEKASLRGANLKGADLFRTFLNGAILLDADLRETSLWLADLGSARIERGAIGKALLQEDHDSYLAFQHHFCHISEEEIQKNVSMRHREARDIYRELKTSWLSNGKYSEASWAYIKERRMQRAMYNPIRARLFYSDRLSEKKQEWVWRGLLFHLKYTVKWLLDWLAELTCGYGERPLRTIAIALFVLIIFPIIYWASNGVGWYDTKLDRDVISSDFWDYIIYSVGAFTATSYEGLKAVGTLTRIWTAVEAMLGILLLALLMFTLGNRINRS